MQLPLGNCPAPLDRNAPSVLAFGGELTAGAFPYSFACLGGFTASAHHRRLTGYLTVHTGDRFKPTHTHLRTNELAFDHELIARLHDALEAGIVNAGKIKEALFAHFFGEMRESAMMAQA